MIIHRKIVKSSGIKVNLNYVMSVCNSKLDMKVDMKLDTMRMNRNEPQKL